MAQVNQRGHLKPAEASRHGLENKIKEMRGHEEINNIKREGLNCKKKRAREGDLLIRFS